MPRYSAFLTRKSLISRHFHSAVALGKMVAATARDKDEGGTRLTVEEVSSTGPYTVRVVSNGIGVFTLKADYPDPKKKVLQDEDETEESLKADIARLEKELAAKKAKLEKMGKRSKYN